MKTSSQNSGGWLPAFAVMVAVCTWGLVCMGGLVTSKGVGMAVPDWPTSYGYNMFALPVSTWLTGGVFDEHTHRLWASTVGLLVVALTRWLGGSESRKPLIAVGVSEIVMGVGLLGVGPDWKGAGHFLAGIGGVVLLAGAAWFRNSPVEAPLPRLGWLAFWAVQLQGLLGGLRVVLDKHVFSGTTLGTAFGVFHGCLGQAFLVLLCVIAFRLSGFWRRLPASGTSPSSFRWLLPLATGLVFLQLLLGALMRHQHAGLAIHDFPLAYDQVWPATDAQSLLRYNQNRAEESEVTAFQIQLQMFHRLGGMLAAGAILATWVQALRTGGFQSLWGRMTSAWASLVLVQVLLGIFTILRNKPADVATAHVAVGALTLVTGCLLVLVSRRQERPAPVSAETGDISALAPATR